MHKRPRTHSPLHTSVAQSSRALLAACASASLAVSLTATPAHAEEATAEAYLADLVSEASDTQRQVTELENQLGGEREQSNKARVDLDRAQRQAQEAQDEVVKARKRLDDAEKDVTSAQARLDEVARSAYQQGGDAAPVTLAAADDSAVSDNLDRSTYIRLAAEKQQSIVDRLDLKRTQSANQESSLRSNRDGANNALSRAVDAHNAAREAMLSSQRKLNELKKRYSALLREQRTAQAKLNAAKRAIDRIAKSKPQASSFEKRAAAEAAVEKVEKNGANAADASSETAGAAQAGTTRAATAHATRNAQAEQPTAARATISRQAEDLDSNGPGDASAAAESTTAAETETDTTATGTGRSTNMGAAAATAVTEDAAGAADTIAATATADTAATPAEANTAPATAADAGETAPTATGSANTALPAVNQPNTQFANNAAGDAQRQSALDSLVAAGSSAAMAGFQAYANGADQSGSLSAAVSAGRSEAARQYKKLQSQPNPGATAPTVGAGEGTDGTAETTPTTPTVPTAPADTTVDASGTAAEKIERVINRGMGQLGMPYAWGGGNHDGPTLGIRDGGVADQHGDYAKIGFDCSGLVMYSFAAVGIKLDHYSGYQYQAGRQVPVSEAKRGDLLFWGPNGSQHVAIYLGNDQMLEAPQSGDVVKVSPVRWSGMTPNAVRLIE